MQTGNPLFSPFQFPYTVPLHAFPLLIARDQQYQVVPKYSWGEEDELMTMNPSSPTLFNPAFTLFLPLFTYNNGHNNSFSRSNRRVMSNAGGERVGSGVIKVLSSNSEMCSYPPIRKSLSHPHLALYMRAVCSINTAGFFPSFISFLSLPFFPSSFPS